jgi:hypothetical protein
MCKLFRHAASQASQRGGATLVGIAVLAAAAALTCAVMWAMHITAKSVGVPEYSKAVTASGGMESAQGPAGRDAVARMFGPATGVVSGAREIEGVQLQGIVTDKRGTGVALLSVDGAPPVRVRAGQQVREGVTLVEIQQRKVLLRRGGSSVELVLPARVSSPVAAVAGKPPGAAAGIQTGAGAPATVR